MRSDLPRLPWLWPFGAALHLGAATLDSLGDAFGEGPDETAEPRDELPWTTPHEIVLETGMFRLRQFGKASGRPVLIVAPYALHGAQLADLAPGHSLIEQLLADGLPRVLLLEWRAATGQMRFLAIDDYLARLVAVLDDIGAPVDVVGLCQGGWLALMLAARFGHKVSRLVLAGAPIDLDAAPSALTVATRGTVPAVFQSLVKDGGGLLSVERARAAWNIEALSDEDVGELLQTTEPEERVAARLRAWHAEALALPGAYFLEVVERLFRDNELARGDFVALGRRLDLRAVTAPVFLVGSPEDDVCPLGQLLAAASLVGTSSGDIGTVIGTGRHSALFFGARNLATVWREVAHWLAQPRPRAVKPR